MWWCAWMVSKGSSDDGLRVLGWLVHGRYLPSDNTWYLPTVWYVVKWYSLSLVSTTRVDGWPVSITRQHGLCWWVMETGHPSTRAVNSGSGNRALLVVRANCTVNQPDYANWSRPPKFKEGAIVTGKPTQLTIAIIDGATILRVGYNTMMWAVIFIVCTPHLWHSEVR